MTLHPVPSEFPKTVHEENFLFFFISVVRYLMGGEQEWVWKDIWCGELTGPRAAAAAVQELRVGQCGSWQARKRFRLLIIKDEKKIITGSVPDPDPKPPDPRVFWPPGSESTRQRYGSGSFYHHAKIIRKTLNPTILWLFLTFYLWKIMYKYLQKVTSRKNCVIKLIFCWHLEAQWRK